MPDAIRILTIEDDSAVRSGISAYLEDSGFEMIEAEDGRSGIEQFRRERPDLVLCDLRLPGVDGLEVLSTITAESPETPVIIVSGVSLVGYAVEALKRGAWDYVIKPIPELGMLENAVRRVLERAQLMRENREYREHLESLNRELRRTLAQLEEDERAGRRIQFQLLPAEEWRVGDYTFSRRLYPSTFLSGDFLDYFPIDERHVGFYIADVAGHGAASAFVTVMLATLMGQYREAYRQDGDETILTPPRTLERLNRDLCRQNLDKHLTMFYGVIDRTDNAIYCCSGGQFPYPILVEDGRAKPLTCRSGAVGLFEDTSYRGMRLPLPESFALWLVSDGLLDVLPQGRLREKQEALRAHLSREDASIDGLAAALGLESQAGFPDDVTLLVVQRRRSDG
jgi:phosphoserine phosphatase RsbU/P